MCCAVCRVVWQTDGATPLFLASEDGHVECVLALLRGGAAINQATVGSVWSTTWPCGGCVRGALVKTACARSILGVWNATSFWREVVQDSAPMSY
jgi:hypothetical protein